MNINAISLNADLPAVGVEKTSDNGKRMPANPFVGLRPFESDESFLFFGRDKQILTLVQQLQSKHFLAVVGSSGCGKSSLIRAGLIPKLKAGFLIERRDHWRIAIMKPGESPLTNLAKTVLGLASKPSEPDDISAFAGQLRVAGAEAAVEILTKPLKDAEANILLVVDQFEELFRYDQPAAQVVREGEDNGASIQVSNEEAVRAENAKREYRRNEAASFVSTILELASQRELPIYLVMTMRSDFLGDCDTFQGLPETINETFYLVPRLTRQQRIEVIEKPIRLYGEDITSRLLDLVTNDVGDESDQLPIMQHALMRTWEKWKQKKDSDKAIDLPDYEAAEMISGALSKDAEVALHELADDEKTIAKRLFQALVETDAQGRNVRRPARLTQLAGIADVTPGKILEVIDHFRRDGRCFLTLTSERVEDDPLVDISHESLIRQWEQLGKWVRSENYSKDQYTRVAAAALRYSVDKGSLLTGTDLHLAVDWWGNRKPNEAWSLRYNRDFHIAEKFLGESKAQSDKERAEGERQRLRELERERIQKQNKKLRRMMYALGVLALAALLGVGGTAFSSIRASRNLTLAETARDDAKKQSNFALSESARATREAIIAQDQANEATKQTDLAQRETVRANAAAQLAQERLGQVQKAQADLKLLSAKKQGELIQQRKQLIDQLGTNYLEALSLAGSSKTLEQAVISYEDILTVYKDEGARGGQLSTLLVLARLFDGSISLSDKDPDRALTYYNDSLGLFNIDDPAQRVKKIQTFTKMGELLNTSQSSKEAAEMFEAAIALGYQPKIDETRYRYSPSVFGTLADLYYGLPDQQNLRDARKYYELELSYLDRGISASRNDNSWIGAKVTALIKLGTANWRMGNKPGAKEKYEQAISIATSPPLEMPAINPLTRIGASLNRPEEKAVRDEYLNKALDSVTNSGDSKADAYKKVGDTLINALQYQEALTYLKQAEAMYGAVDAKLAPTFRSMAVAYEGLKMNEEALKYYNLALSIYQKLKLPSAISSIKYRIQLLDGKP